MALLPEHFPGEHLAIRIWETFEKAGIGLISPAQIRREGKARADVRRMEQLVDLQTQQDIEELRAGRRVLNRDLRLLGGPSSEGERKEPMLFRPITSPEMMLETAQRLALADSTQKLLNLRKIAVMAEQEAEQMEAGPLSDNSVDPDWFTKWRIGAENTTHDDLQRLWAKVLAGEVQGPGSYSGRTLAFLSTLSKADAKAIAQAAQGVVEGMLVRRVGGGPFTMTAGVGLLEVIGLNLGHLIHLQEIGLVEGAETGYKRTINKANNPLGPTDRLHLGLACNNKAIFIEHENVEASTSISGYLLTQVGREVLSLGAFEGNLPYLEAVAREVKKALPAPVKVSIGDRVISADKQQYTGANLVEIDPDRSEPEPSDQLPPEPEK